MKDTELLLTVVSTLWLITLGLVSYIIKSKDNAQALTNTALVEIKELINGINLQLASIKTELDNNIYATRKLDEIVVNHFEIISKLRIEEVKHEGRITALEKDISRLNR